MPMLQVLGRMYALQRHTHAEQSRSMQGCNSDSNDHQQLAAQ